MRISFHIRAIVFGLLCCFVLLPVASAQKAKLSRAQVEQSIQAHLPDEVVASQVRSRGLSFPVTRKIVEALAAKGAGSQTLAALRELIILGKGRVKVETVPGTRLFLDGKDAGNAGADGVFLLMDVVEGDHEVVARSEGYRDTSSKFSLENDEDKQISLQMEWLGGYLSISAQPSSARIQVSGTRSFEGSFMDGALPAGSYTATVSSDGYITQTRNFQIGAEEHHAEQFQLAIDLAVAQARANAGDDSSLEILKQAIDRGEQIICNVKTGGFDYNGVGPYVNDGIVTVNKTSVSYQYPIYGAGYVPAFTVSPDKILLLAYEKTVPLSVHLKVAIMNKKGTKENKSDFSFYNSGAAVVDTVGRADASLYMYTKGIACDGCDYSLIVLFRLLEKVHTGN